MKKGIEIETERLILRPWAPEDAEALYKYASDPEIGIAAGWEPHKSVDDSLGIIRTVFAAPETYAMALKSTGEPVGSIGIMFTTGLHSAGMEKDEAEIGYWIGRPYWGQGLTPEAVRRLLKRCFLELRLNAVWCGHYEGNDKSRRVMEKCGFTFHHSERCKVSPLGDVRTEHFTRISRDKWYRQNGMASFRTMNPADSHLLRELFHDTVLTVNAADYTQEETQDWASCGDREGHWERLTGTMHFIAAMDTDGEMTGFAGIRDDGYLHSMFIHKDWQRYGIATVLLEKMEKYAADHCVSEITSEVSITARGFFESRGYSVVTEQRRRANRLELTNFVMKKRLPDGLKKRVFIDMDNVLVDFQSGIDRQTEEILREYEGRTDEIPGLFAEMLPMPGAIEAVHELQKHFDLYILSTAPWKNPSAWSDKVKWVTRHLDDVFHKRMVITHCKNLCKGDYLIDDRGKNGTSEFEGEWIQFGSARFPDWDAVVSYLLKGLSPDQK